MNLNKPNAAFTLFEVLVALGLFALVAFSLVELLQNAIATEEEIRLSESVTQGLSNQLAMVTSKKIEPTEQDLANPVSNSPITYHLSITQIQLYSQDKTILNGMYKITLTATWPEDQTTEKREISQLLYQP